MSSPETSDDEAETTIRIVTTATNDDCEILGRFGYMVSSPINKGGSSVVLLAHKRCGRTCTQMACKVIVKDEYVTVGLNEAEKWAKLNHKNVLKLSEFIQTERAIYFFTSYQADGDLTTFLANFDVPTDLRITWIKEICQSLNYIHSRNICHRDVKTSNVLVHNGKEGRSMKLTDFGLACYRGKGLYDIRPYKTFCGTFNYMAPEILSGRPYDAGKIDLYSFGVLSYYVLYETYPFCGRSEQDILQQINRGVKFPVDRSVSNSLQNMMRDLLSIDPSSRHEAKHLIKSRFWYKY